MTAVPAGLVTERAPLGLRAAEVAFSVLAEQGPRPRSELVDRMVEAGYAPESATTLLRTAIRRGDLLVISRDEQGRPTLALPVVPR